MVGIVNTMDVSLSFKFVRSLSMVMLGVGLFGCTSTIYPTTYLKQTLHETPMVTDAYGGKFLDSHPQPDSYKIMMTERLFGWSLGPGKVIPTEGFGVLRDSKYGNKPKTSRLKNQGMLDAAVQFDVHDGLPIYRLVITPRANISEARVASWAPWVQIYTYGKGSRSDATKEFYVPLPQGNRLKHGQIVTDWAYCQSCFNGGKRGENLSELQEKAFWLDRGAKSMTEKAEEFRQKILQREQDPEFAAKLSAKMTERTLTITSEHFGINFRDNKYIPKDVAVGWEAANQARKGTLIALEQFKIKYQQSQAGNANYEYFIENKYKPLWMSEFVDAKKCGQYYSEPDTMNNWDWNYDRISENEGFIRCVKHAVDDYNFAAYARLYPDLKAKEETLWAKTFGIERTHIPSAEGQLDIAKGYISGAYNGIERIGMYIKYREDKLASSQREKAMWQQSLGNFERDWQRRVVNMENQKIVVKPNGVITTVGDEKKRAWEVAQTQALLNKAKKAKPEHHSGNSQSQNKSMVIAAKSSDVRSASAAAEDEAPNSPTSATQTATSQQESSSSAPNSKQLAKKAWQEQQQQKAKEQTATMMAQQKAIEDRAKELQQEAKRKAEIQPISGGMNGCIDLLEVKRYPGSSALSSCSYSTPDRYSTEFVFHNRCEVPLNVTIDIVLDNGKTAHSTEYDIRPGRNLTSNAHCGLYDYSYRYEETRDSLRKRREQQ